MGRYPEVVRSHLSSRQVKNNFVTQFQLFFIKSFDNYCYLFWNDEALLVLCHIITHLHKHTAGGYDYEYVIRSHLSSFTLKNKVKTNSARTFLIFVRYIMSSIQKRNNFSRTSMKHELHCIRSIRRFQIFLSVEPLIKPIYFTQHLYINK